MEALDDLARPSYLGMPPIEYKHYVFGMERASILWPELITLGEQEWKEVGDDIRLGGFKPDFVAVLRHELQGNFAAFTIRHHGVLAGYFVGVVGHPLKTAGQSTLNEVGVYISEEVRAGHLFRKFLEYVEVGATHFGCDALIVSHRPEHTRIGKLYQRYGYTPLSHDYIKKVS